MWLERRALCGPANGVEIRSQGCQSCQAVRVGPSRPAPSRFWPVSKLKATGSGGRSLSLHMTPSSNQVSADL